jgi:catechol 2,3-dioxygenase-like lactoylglutathione lyase family enzyme
VLRHAGQDHRRGPGRCTLGEASRAVLSADKTVPGSPGTLGAMSISPAGLRTVIYPAPDLDAAKTWWSQLLGVEPYFDEPFYVGFAVAGYELGLLPDADPADGALVYWGVDDVSAAVAQALAVGAVEHVPVAEVGEGIVTATVRTPAGSILGLIFNPHFDGH